MTLLAFLRTNRRRAASTSVKALACCAALTLSIATPVAQTLTQRNTTPATPATLATLPNAAVDAEQRVAALEASLGQLRSDARATQAVLAGLQARLAEAQAQAQVTAPDRSVIFPLTWVAALLTLSTLALGRLLWRDSRHPTVAWWLAPPTEAASAPQHAAATLPVQRPVPPVWPPQLPDRPPLTRAASAVPARNALADTGEGALPMPMPPFQLGTESAVVSGARSHSALEASALGPASLMSAQALIDLEQHVDFFVALGEDDSAIELLMGLVRSDAGSSVMPYLKLLEIYRRRGETEAYERIQERVSRRFNAAAPAWSSGLLAGQLPVAVPVPVSLAGPQSASDAMVDLLLPFGAQRTPFLFSDFAPMEVDLDLSDPLAAKALTSARTAKTRDHGTSAVER